MLHDSRRLKINSFKSFNKNTERFNKKFNKVIIETTGLADPVPIIHTLMTSIDLVRAYKFDGIITMVDVINGDKTFNNHLNL